MAGPSGIGMLPGMNEEPKLSLDLWGYVSLTLSGVGVGETHRRGWWKAGLGTWVACARARLI